MSQQEHNKTISAKAFNLLCEDVPFWGIETVEATIRQASASEIEEAMKNDYDIESFYYDVKRNRIVAILWRE